MLCNQVSLKEMYNGATRKLALQKNVICEDCGGLGGPEGAVQRCSNCRGSGMQVLLLIILIPNYWIMIIK